MIKITENDINNAFFNLDSSKENPFEGVFERMDSDQPNITDYLYEVEGDALNNDERDLLLNIAIIAWYVLDEKIELESKITEEELDSQLERNTSLFDENSKSNNDLDEETLKLFSKFNKQPEFMDFLISLVMNRPHDFEGNIRKEMELIILLHIKTVVDVIINNIG